MNLVGGGSGRLARLTGAPLPRRPYAPYSPNTGQDWLTALLVGLLFAVGLVGIVEYLDDTVKTPDDVSRRLHLPLLGLVPAVRGERPPVAPPQFARAKPRRQRVSKPR